jgi:hypothetical protein
MTSEEKKFVRYGDPIEEAPSPETEQPAAETTAELPTGMADAINHARNEVRSELATFLSESASEDRKRECMVTLLQARHRQKVPNGHWRIS